MSKNASAILQSFAGPRSERPAHRGAGGIRRKVSRWLLLRKKRSEADSAAPYALRPEADQNTLALVTLLGVETGRAAQMVRAAQQRLTQFDRLVFVLSAPDLVEATRGGAVVELLPGLRELAGHEAGELRRYLESRQNQILQKWQPDVVLHYGLSLDAYILVLITQISGDGSNPF